MLDDELFKQISCLERDKNIEKGVFLFTDLLN